MGVEFGPILRVEMNGVDITSYLRRWTYRVMDTDGIRRHVVWLLHWSGLPRPAPRAVAARAVAGDIVKSRRCFTRRGAERLGRRWVREMEATP